MIYSNAMLQTKGLFGDWHVFPAMRTSRRAAARGAIEGGSKTTSIAKGHGPWAIASLHATWNLREMSKLIMKPWWKTIHLYFFYSRHIISPLVNQYSKCFFRRLDFLKNSPCRQRKSWRAEASSWDETLRWVQYQLQSSHWPPSESPSNQLHEASGRQRQFLLKTWRCHINYMSSCNWFYKLVANKIRQICMNYNMYIEYIYIHYNCWFTL